MRAHWEKSLIVQETYSLKDESLHHLVNAVRIESGEDLLLLNGDGLRVETIVESISKKELRLKYKSHQTVTRKYNFDLAIGIPKREALELCLKEATELGFRRIYLVRSDFSQTRVPEADRLEKLMVSALEQSNAAYLPELTETNWSEISFGNYSESILLDSQSKATTPQTVLTTEAERLLIVGPEGGFSAAELTYLHAIESIKVVNLPTPILRTPTAVATGAGIMIQSLLK